MLSKYASDFRNRLFKSKVILEKCAEYFTIKDDGEIGIDPDFILLNPNIIIMTWLTVLNIPFKYLNLKVKES